MVPSGPPKDAFAPFGSSSTITKQAWLDSKGAKTKAKGWQKKVGI